MDDFSEITVELKEVRDNTHKNTTAIKVLETTVLEKHISIIEKIEKITREIEKFVNSSVAIHKTIEDEVASKLLDIREDVNFLKTSVGELNELASTSKASLKTIWLIGGLIAGAVGLFSGLFPGFKQ